MENKTHTLSRGELSRGEENRVEQRSEQSRGEHRELSRGNVLPSENSQATIHSIGQHEIIGK
jgi:hypothetical protein